MEKNSTNMKIKIFFNIKDKKKWKFEKKNYRQKGEYSWQVVHMHRNIQIIQYWRLP